LVSKLKPKHFKEMAAIEARYYSDEFITDWQDAYDWYLYSEDTCVAVADHDKVIAFMNLFPISERFYGLIATGGSHDGFLDLSDVLRIRDDASGDYSLFLSCLAVHPEYRKSQGLNMVIKEYVSRYRAYQLHGARFNSVITHNVTRDGERFSERMAFEHVLSMNNKTTVSVAEFERFMACMSLRGGSSQ